MASEELIRTRQERFGDLHWSEDDGYDRWNINVGGPDRPYVLIRLNPDTGGTSIHGNVAEEKLPDLFVNLAFQVKGL